jgi:hypothetical protein
MARVRKYQVGEGQHLIICARHRGHNRGTKKLLKDICYVIFNASNAGTSEGISKGTRDGTLLIATNISETGFTFFNIKRVISIG